MPRSLASLIPPSTTFRLLAVQCLSSRLLGKELQFHRARTPRFTLPDCCVFFPQSPGIEQTYSYARVQDAIKRSKELSGTHSDLLVTRLEMLEKYLGPDSEMFPFWSATEEQVVTIVRNARLLALIDFIISLMNSSPIPQEAIDAIPIVFTDLTPFSVRDPSLQRLFVDTMRGAVQPRASDALESNLPIALSTAHWYPGSWGQLMPRRT